MALAPRLALGARCARPIRLSCRIAELSELAHEPCSDAKQKGAQGPFFWHWRSSRTVSINGLGSKGGENYPAEQLQLKGVLRPCFVCIPCDTVELWSKSAKPSSTSAGLAPCATEQPKHVSIYDFDAYLWEIQETPSRLAMGYPNYESITDQATGSITSNKDQRSSYCSLAATSLRKNMISDSPSKLRVTFRN